MWGSREYRLGGFCPNRRTSASIKKTRGGKLVLTLLVSESPLGPLLFKQAGGCWASLQVVSTSSYGYVSLEDSKSSHGGGLAARESGEELLGSPQSFEKILEYRRSVQNL